MLQMAWKTDEDEKIMDLADTPEFVLVKFCDGILRHQDIRNPATQRTVQEIINALKVKLKEASASDWYNLKSYITQVDDLLKQFA